MAWLPHWRGEASRHDLTFTIGWLLAVAPGLPAPALDWLSHASPGPRRPGGSDAPRAARRGDEAGASVRGLRRRGAGAGHRGLECAGAAALVHRRTSRGRCLRRSRGFAGENEPRPQRRRRAGGPRRPRDPGTAGAAHRRARRCRHGRARGVDGELEGSGSRRHPHAGGCGRNRAMAASCDEQLRGLASAIAAHEIAATR